MNKSNLLSRRQAIVVTGAAATATAVIGASVVAAKRRPNVAFLFDRDVTLIDFAGPWEVFLNADGPSPGFGVFSVAPKRVPLRTDGGLSIIPDYALADAPPADIIVIPAQRLQPAVEEAEKLEWLKTRSDSAELIVSVCTGAFLLARTGLLDGKRATTHHAFQDRFAATFPRVNVVRNVRYVDDGKLITAGGLTSGIDAAFHIVKRYHGVVAAEETAKFMAYESRNWS